MLSAHIYPSIFLSLQLQLGRSAAMSLQRFEHVCSVLRSPFATKEHRLRMTRSYINNYCNCVDLTDWIVFLLSPQAIMDPNDDHNMLIVPVFVTLNVTTRISIIDLYKEFVHKIPTDIRTKWNKITQNHLLPQHIYRNNKLQTEHRHKDVEMKQSIANVENAKEEAEDESLNHEEVFDTFVHECIAFTMKQLNDIETENDTDHYNRIWTVLKPKMDAFSVESGFAMNSADIMKKDSLFYKFYIVKFLTQMISENGSNAALKSFLLWLLFASDVSCNDTLHVYLWLFIPKIISDPKSRVLRDIVYKIMERNELLMHSLLPFLVGLSFIFDQISQFIQSLLISNHKIFNSNVLSDLLQLFCEFDWPNDDVCNELLLINAKYKPNQMEIECFKVVLTKLEYHSQCKTYSDSYIRFLTQFLMKNKKHSQLYKQRLTQMVDTIASNTSIRVQSLKKFVDKLQ
eukprot:1056815_1